MNSTVATAFSSSPLAQLYPSWSRGSIPISKRRSRRSFNGRTALIRLKPPPRAALVEATPPRSVPAVRDGSIQVFALPGDRADDLQAEARAMARAANASVYSPQVLATKYGSQPIKVLLIFHENLKFLVGYFGFMD